MKAIATETGYLFIGTAREICSLYKNFMRREIAIPAFCNFPKFNMSKYYGLSVDISSSKMPIFMMSGMKWKLRQKCKLWQVIQHLQ